MKRRQFIKTAGAGLAASAAITPLAARSTITAVILFARSTIRSSQASCSTDSTGASRSAVAPVAPVAGHESAVLDSRV